MKIRFYRTIAENRSLDAFGLWVIDAVEKRKIKAMEINYCRRCNEKIKPDSIRNTGIKECLGIDIDIIETIEAKRLRWYGHMKRLENKRLPKQVWQKQIPTRKKKPKSAQHWTERTGNSMRNMVVKNRSRYRLRISSS